MVKKSYSKLVGCNIHNSIRLSAMALKIVNTYEFQRMRNIKQLGFCYLVYPAAMHSRFEHSLGVYHLAGKMLDRIIQLYPNKKYLIPELNAEPISLTKKIIECIKIGALCHDIGHGPFSHIFDNVLLKNIDHPNKEHEARSCLIVELLCKRELKREINDKYISFIKSIIDPKPENKGAIYQIVANKLNGIDVDKFDYLERDSKNLGMSVGFCANRLINEFIIDENDNIAYPKHSSTDVYELFHSRYMMHKKAYSHKTVKIIEQMFGDIFKKIDPIFKYSDFIKDMNLFCTLTDNTIVNSMEILVNHHPPVSIIIGNEFMIKIREAYTIYHNIMTRKLFKLIFELSNVTNGDTIIQDFKDLLYIKYPKIKYDIDYVIVKSRIGLAGCDIDPFNSVYFYDRQEDEKSFTIKKKSISGLANDVNIETHWYCICKKRKYNKILKNIYNELKYDRLS